VSTLGCTHIIFIHAASLLLLLVLVRLLRATGDEKIPHSGAFGSANGRTKNARSNQCLSGDNYQQFFSQLSFSETPCVIMLQVEQSRNYFGINRHGVGPPKLVLPWRF
jgi:hypothetical protein